MKLLVLLVLAGLAPGSQAERGYRWRSAPPGEGVPRRPRPATSPALIEQGASFYQRGCATCHGPEGRGDGILASRLRTPPRDFTVALYKVRSTPSGTLPTDLDLFQTISRGMHGSDMAPWRRLSEQERWGVVEFLKTLSPRFRSEGQGDPMVVSPPPRGGRSRLRQQGAALYARLQCRNCHGPTGRGDGPGVFEYASEGRRVRIRDLARADFIRGDTARDIYLTLQTGIDGTPMGAYELPSEDLWSLAVYVQDVVRRPPAPDRRTPGSDDRASSH